MIDFIGSLITQSAVTPTTASASGRWTVTEAAKYIANGTWPGSTADPYFDYTTLLLTGDGTNGAQNNTFVSTNSTPTGVGTYAGYFDGVGDYVNVADNTVLDLPGDFTIECWLYRIPRTGETVTRFLSKGNYQGGVSEWIMYLDAATGNLGMAWGTGTDAIGLGNIASYQWAHIAVSRSGTTLRTFFNGTLAATQTVSVDFTSAAPVYIGADEAVPANAQWSGYISNVRIVKGTALYTANFPVPTSPLTAVSGTSLLTCNSATFVDNSGNGLTVTAVGNAVVATVSAPAITRSGNTTQGSFNPYGNYWSNYFDGTGDYLTIPDNAVFDFGTGDFTVEAWVYPVSLANSTGGSIAAGLGPTNGDWMFAMQATDIRWGRNHTAWDLISSGFTPTLNTWIHVAVCRSGTTLRLFANGTQVASATNSQSYVITATLAIGARQSTAGAATAGEFWFGYISNLRIIKGSALYTGNFTPPTAPLTAVSGTSLLTCQSNTFKDSSSNNFAVTRVGDVKVLSFSPYAPGAAYQATVNGASAYYDGTGDALTAAASQMHIFPGNFTIGFWYYLSSTTFTGGSAFVQGTNPYFAININTNGAGYGIWLNSLNAATFTTANTIQTGCWNYVALVRSGSTVTCYHNGVSVGTSTSSAALGYSLSTLIQTLGPGYMSDLRILNGVADTSVPTTPSTAITGTSLLLNFQNAGVVDSTAKNTLETVGNAQINTTTKKYGTGSVAFDGTGDYLSIPYNQDVNITTGDFTIEGWVYFNSVAAGQALIFNYNAATNFGWALYTSGAGTLGYYLGSTGTTWNIASGISVGSIVIGQWYYFALVRSGSTFTPYLNGVAGTTATSSSALFNGSLPICVGGNSSGNNFNGYVDDLRVTKGIARYTSNFTPPSAPFPIF